ncbi:acyl-CoA reductase [Leeuwenhoekiella marinoflava]|uniref:Acyl-CoA reductase LuxC n=2 Tax=Leeuwenhoekiella marinoflava TaxID=988 RepID=A0A4V1KSS1_9FLAO|nr:acyl-CoA reductase [Leeuwenhoekiella marinoflava]RXG32718.1 acyl-CoA reductase LuxC [Leeuwenhoekiella marinoflava]SHE54578.1 Acyl-CoA reductase (LuxC) [Leeuwenhoekiella marinoflava DSM 3653]
MDLNQRITAFANLGQFLKDFMANAEKTDLQLVDFEILKEKLHAVIETSKRQNAWFSTENTLQALQSWSKNLEEESLHTWLSPYAITQTEAKEVAVIMAGNLPLVGFHDFLSVLITGHKVIAKLSSDDQLLLPFLAKVLIQLEPQFKDRITFTQERLPKFDAVIATGSNNTARYFEFYFKNKPNIIRKNRNAVSVLTGNETHEQLVALGADIFGYFGMGCRSVSKLFVPKAYNFDAFFKALFEYKDIINHHKYANNYDYNKAVYLMSLFPILDNEFMILKEDENFSSPISVVFYERYNTKTELQTFLSEREAEIQCVVADDFSENEIPFGQAQQPKLNDYADGVDTVAFLLKIS